MAERKLPFTVRRIGKKPVLVLVGAIHFASMPAAAVHGTVPCEISESLEPLLMLLHSIAQLAYVAGIGLAVVTLCVAGIGYMWPDPEKTRWAKKIAQGTIIGVVILLSARFIIAWLVTQLPVCT